MTTPATAGPRRRAALLVLAAGSLHAVAAMAQPRAVAPRPGPA